MLSTDNEDNNNKEAKAKKSTILEEMKEIQRLRIMGTDDETIRNRLKLSRHQYYRRVKRMNKIDRDYVAKNLHKELASEIVLLQNRLLATLRNAEAMATSDEVVEVKDRIEAERLKINCSINLVKLLHEGPAVLLSSGYIPPAEELSQKEKKLLK